MKLTNEEKDILIRLINNELEYYKEKEDLFMDDVDYVEKLNDILKKVGK